MIIGIGLDLIELDRIKNTLTKKDKIIQRILTPKEQELFHGLPSENRKVEFLAGRFAAKEAFAKAAGSGLGNLSFQHIEVLKNELGAPTITARGFTDCKIFVSITHSKQFAAAQVIIEK